jgi:adenylate cyclase class 2
MPLEIEAKMKLPDFTDLRLRLMGLRAISAGSHIETNTFFDTSDGALRRNDKGLRLRATYNVKDADTDYIVTFKGPRQPGQLKTRQEIEFAVDNPEATVAAFEALGFTPTISFQKRRESWTLLGCKIELDELPYLGFYVEVEGQSADQVMMARDALALTQEPIITTSYASLLADYARDNSIPAQRINFP